VDITTSSIPKNFKTNKKFISTIKDSAISQMLHKIELMPYQVELIKLQEHLEREGMKMIVLFDGRDASGKGGTIRRVARYMNEKHYRVVALGKPTEAQQTELHMKRYIEQFPHAGEVVMYDRSWYNRAMVEPVFGFCTQKEYRDFLNSVNSYEKSFVADGKTILLKLYFSVTKAEQKRRFDRRKNDPLRQWKLSEIDLQAQKYWGEFTEMKFNMLKKTSTVALPWHVIRSDDKNLARVETMKLILNSVDYEGRDPDIDYELNPNVIISGQEEVEIMAAQYDRYGEFRR
jgi:polyphosphate kinase